MLEHRAVILQSSKIFQKNMISNASLTNKTNLAKKLIENLLACNQYLGTQEDLQTPEFFRDKQFLNMNIISFLINLRKDESLFEAIYLDEQYKKLAEIINLNQEEDEEHQQEEHQQAENFVNNNFHGGEGVNNIPGQNNGINNQVPVDNNDDNHAPAVVLGNEDNKESFKLLWSSLVDFKLNKPRRGFWQWLKIIPDFFHDVVSGIGLVTRGIVRSLFYLIRHPSVIVGNGWLWGKGVEDEASQWRSDLQKFNEGEEIKNNDLYFYVENGEIWYKTKKFEQDAFEKKLIGNDNVDDRNNPILTQQDLFSLNTAIENNQLDQLSSDIKDKILKITAKRGDTSQLNPLQYFIKEVGVGFDNFISRPFETAKSLLDFSENNFIARITMAVVNTFKAIYESNHWWEDFKNFISNKISNAWETFKQKPVRYVTEFLLWLATIIVTWKFVPGGGTPPPTGEEVPLGLTAIKSGIDSINNANYVSRTFTMTKGFVPPVTPSIGVTNSINFTTKIAPSTLPSLSVVPKTKPSPKKESINNNVPHENLLSHHPKNLLITSNNVLTNSFKEEKPDLLQLYKENLLIFTSEKDRQSRNSLIDEIIVLESELKPIETFFSTTKQTISALKETLYLYDEEKDKKQIATTKEEMHLYKNDLLYYNNKLLPYKTPNQETNTFIWEKENTTCLVGNNRSNHWSENNKKQVITKVINTQNEPEQILQQKGYQYNCN